ncbi:DUF1254 domain-containing protein [Pseudomonas sp. PB120]|nr:DUF1254 domain-containing protein [Pseudomonas sp. PB120]MVV47826.1 DUF1254 domain-containing protein [Pseudomonas sp. PB120]
MLITQALTAVALTVAASITYPLASYAQSEIAPQSKAPVNMFMSVPGAPSKAFSGSTRSDVDTLYSIAWLDLTKEPQIIAAPNTGGRFYVLPMLDMWSDVFASPDSSTTDTHGGQFLVTPPGWTGTVPAGLNHLPSPTSFVWIIGRTRVDAAADYAAVHKIQDGYTVTPLSQMSTNAEPANVNVSVVTPL